MLTLSPSVQVPQTTLADFLSVPPQSAETYGTILALLKVFSEVGYDVNDAFDKFGCDAVYEGKVVCVSAAARVRGLGTELVKRSIQVTG